MPNSNSEYIPLLKRSILWLTIIAVVMGGTYYFQGSILQKQFAAITASVATKELPIYSVETDKKAVAISFDAAWGNEDTQKILSTLKEQDVYVTFFMTGGWVEAYPDDVKAIYEAGHDLGNHSENHKNMSRLSNAEICDELNKVTERVEKITGYKMELFRPPYGDYDNHVIANARECGYYTIQWDVDSLDWKNYGVDNIVNTILNHKQLKNGSIILMHNGAKYTAEALPKIIKGLKEKGYEIVPVSKLIIRDYYHMEQSGRQVSDEKQSESGTKKEPETKQE